MQWIDWILLATPVALVSVFAAFTRRYTRSVADFMAGSRCAGRYLICNAKGEAGSGVANTMSRFQVFMVSGFVLSWWNSISMPVLLLVGISGFVIYRYRQTRAMTLGQFFELRYSRRFRLFAGVLGYVAGLLNYGIFPAVSSWFFVYFMGLPERVHFLGWNLPTNVIVMAAYLSVVLWMMATGGQITLMVTDCVEGLLSHVIYVVVIAAVFCTISWAQMRSTLLAAPPGHSLVNPFDALKTRDFNVWYVIMSLIQINIYATMAWQNGHGFNSAARTPHESRMGNVLGNWRDYSRQVMLVVLAMAALTFTRHPDFAGRTIEMHRALHSISDPAVQNQMTVPIALRYLLPVGVKGLFCAIMLLGLLAGDASHILSWGGIFIQDIVLPLRSTPLTEKQHMLALRLSVGAVALFAFCFSIFFRQTQYIAMWWAVTMGIFTAGAGAAIIGGLYWKKGTTAAAWVAVITGSVLAFGGIIASYKVKGFPLNGTEVSFIASAASVVVYIATSLLTCREEFNMDRMLHRGVYGDGKEAAEPPRGWRQRMTLSALLGFNTDYTFWDRIVAGGLFFWAVLWLAILLVGSAWNMLSPWPSGVWAGYWFVTGIVLPIVIAVGTLIWFGIGGVMDLRLFFRQLARLKRDARDDGTVRVKREEVSEVIHS